MNADESRKLIEAAGGDAAFARLLCIELQPGVRQRVNNWKRRGIPSSVVLEHHEQILALQRQAGPMKTAAGERREVA